MNPEPSASLTSPEPPSPVQTSEPAELITHHSSHVTAAEPSRLTRHGLTIAKRNAKPHAKYTTRIRFRGKVHELTLAETAKDSFEIAVRSRREIHAGRWLALKAGSALRGARHVTLEKLKTAYLASAVEAGTATRTQNWHALVQLLGDRDPSAIDAALAAEWFRTAAAKADDCSGASVTAAESKERAAKSKEQAAESKERAADSQQRQATLKRSANSRFQQAASVFAPRALAGYKLAGIDCSGFEKFLAAGELHRFVRLPKQQYNPPSELIIAATLAAWETLEDRNLFLVIGHELAFGLRAGETAQAKWSWWTERETYPVLDGAGEFKNGSGLIRVRALDPWFSILRRRIETNGWAGAPDEYIITGTPTQRSDVIYRGASAWLRTQGWQTQKTNHALRAYAGSQIAMRYGIYDAQTWLRHSSVTVTEQHYSHFIKQFRPEDVTALPAKWATKARSFTPVILPAPQSQAS